METLNLFVICDNEQNIFVKQLRAKNINFTLTNKLPNESIEVNPTILLINKGRQENIRAKQLFSEANVLACSGGGKKDFQPYLTCLQTNGNHDYYNYKNWEEFTKLITDPLPCQEKTINLIYGQNYSVTDLTSPSITESKKENLRNHYQSHLRCSIAYLQWYLNWLNSVATIIFKCHFKYPANKKFKNLQIFLTPNELEYQNKKIFSEDDEIVFELYDGTNIDASVKTITDESITVVLQRRTSTKIINNINYFRLKVNLKATNLYKNICEELYYEEGAYPYSAPLSLLSGKWANTNNYPTSKSINNIVLSETEQKILRDTSQSYALGKILSSDCLPTIEGPPGTGKTFVTAVAINKMLQDNRYLIIASHSNQGLDNLLLALSKIVSPQLQSNLFRLGNHVSTVSTECKKFHRSTRFKTEKSEQNKDEEQKTDTQKECEYIGNLIQNNQGLALFVTLNSFPLDTTIQHLLNNYSNPEIGIIDEATKGYLYEILPLALNVKNKLAFIGDHRQLGNINIPEQAKNHMRFQGNCSVVEIEDFADGFFYSSIRKDLLSSSLLKINRRSLEKISNLISQVFYSDQLIPGRFNPYDEGTITFIDTKNLINHSELKRKTSYYNPIEANITVKQFVSCIKKQLNNGGLVTDCAIITPYQAQIREIKRRLRKELLFNSQIKQSGQITSESIDESLEQLINTVDAFQGSERVYIALSLVRSNNSGEIGFNSDLRRLNVALSRAQNSLTIIANSETYLNNYQIEAKDTFKKIVDFVKKYGNYLELKNN